MVCRDTERMKGKMVIKIIPLKFGAEIRREEETPFSSVKLFLSLSLVERET